MSGGRQRQVDEPFNIRALCPPPGLNHREEWNLEALPDEPDLVGGGLLADEEPER